MKEGREKMPNSGRVLDGVKASPLEMPASAGRISSNAAAALLAAPLLGLLGGA